MKIRYSYMILFLFFAPLVMAKEIPDKANAQKNTVQLGVTKHADITAEGLKENAGKKTDGAGGVEIYLLKEQIKLIKEYQGSLLSTVYWSLSAILGLALVLVGFGWWSNIHIYRAEIARLREEVESRTSESESSMELALEESKNVVMELVNEQMQTTTNRLANKVDDLQKQLTSQKESITDIESVIETFADKLDEQYLIAEYNLRVVEEWVWDIRGVVSNILLTQAQSLEASLNVDDKERVGRTLGRIKETLKKYFGDESKDKSVSKLAFDRLTRAVEASSKYDAVESALILETLEGLAIR